jgi:hypothetical protein
MLAKDKSIKKFIRLPISIIGREFGTKLSLSRATNAVNNESALLLLIPRQGSREEVTFQAFKKSPLSREDGAYTLRDIKVFVGRLHCQGRIDRESALFNGQV